MPIQTQWYIPDRVIISVLIGDMSKEEVVNQLAEIKPMIENGKAPVHWINYVEYMTKPYIDIPAYKQMFSALKHPNMGWSVNYGAGKPLNKFTEAIIGQLFQVRTRTYLTWEETRDFLMDMDETLKLAELPPPHANSSLLKQHLGQK